MSLGAPSVATEAAETGHPARDEAIAFVIMTGLFILAPLVVYPFFMMQALCFALFACAFNLLIGYVGLLSFGHAMFLGTAGYLSAHAARVWGLTPEFCILFGVAGSAALGLVTGVLAIRRQGIYFAMITLAVASAFAVLASQLSWLTGGEVTGPGEVKPGSATWWTSTGCTATAT